VKKGEKFGVLLLLVGTIAGVWSAFMPSLMTIGKFGLREGTQEDRVDLWRGAVGFSVVTGLLILGAWKVYR